MKRFVDAFCPACIHIIGEIAVRAKDPRAIRPLGAGIEMNDLSQRMYAGISAAGACHLDGFVRHSGQGILDDGLDADTVPLALPAAVGRAVVLDTERIAISFVIGAYAYPGSESSNCCACCR